MTAIAIATFADEAAFRAARDAARRADHRVLGEWLPYAPSDEEGRPRPILAACLAAGVAAAVALFALEWWSSAAAYPINAGGRPLFSWAAFVPAPVEFGALAAAIGGIVALFRIGGLTRLHHPAFDLDEVARASQGAFVLAIGCDPGADANDMVALVTRAGATHSRIITP